MRHLPDGSIVIDLAFSPCPNDTFMFDALVNGRIDTGSYRFEVSLEDVETLNRQAFDEKRDMTKLSFFAFGKVVDRYVLLDAGSALGNGVGPLFITRPSLVHHPEAWERVAIPGENTTANFLFSLYYPGKAGKQPMVFSAIEGAVLDGTVDAGVIIHENRFTYEQRGLRKIKDLGEAWEQETGKPIPLGGIVAHRSLPLNVLQDLNRLMAESIRFAFRHPEAGEDYVARHAQEMDPAVRKQHIVLYVNAFSEDLGEQGREAVRYLLQKARETGVLPAGQFPPLFVSALTGAEVRNSLNL
jgi:1,4-dihydroxy-6-naphthoate synthase